MSPRKSFAFFTLVLGAIAWPRAAAVAPTFRISPDTVEAGKPFDLRLLGSGYHCNDSFSGEAATISGGRLLLQYHVNTDSAKRCVQPLAAAALPCYVGPDGQAVCPGQIAYGPTFQVQSLEAGSYPVWISVYDQCGEAKPCLYIPVAKLVDTLVVRKGGAGRRRAVWTSPDSVRADSAFKLRLYDTAYGCGQTFTHATATVSKSGASDFTGAILLRYSLGDVLPALCVIGFTAGGPAFDVEALPAGRYLVEREVIPACVYSPAPCPTAVPIPEPVDTVTAFKPGVTALGTGDAPRGVRFHSIGNITRITLPSALPRAGRVRLELYAIDGRLLDRAMSAELPAGARGFAAAWAKGAPGRGSLRLLRLSLPGGGEWLEPVEP